MLPPLKPVVFSFNSTIHIVLKKTLYADANLHGAHQCLPIFYHSMQQDSSQARKEHDNHVCMIGFKGPTTTRCSFCHYRRYQLHMTLPFQSDAEAHGRNSKARAAVTHKAHAGSCNVCAACSAAPSTAQRCRDAACLAALAAHPSGIAALHSGVADSRWLQGAAATGALGLLLWGPASRNLAR